MKCLNKRTFKNDLQFSKHRSILHAFVLKIIVRNMHNSGFEIKFHEKVLNRRGFCFYILLV